MVRVIEKLNKHHGAYRHLGNEEKRIIFDHFKSMAGHTQTHKTRIEVVDDLQFELAVMDPEVDSALASIAWQFHAYEITVTVEYLRQLAWETLTDVNIREDYDRFKQKKREDEVPNDVSVATGVRVMEWFWRGYKKGEVKTGTEALYVISCKLDAHIIVFSAQKEFIYIDRPKSSKETFLFLFCKWVEGKKMELEVCYSVNNIILKK